jgi:hypothetical protein
MLSSSNQFEHEIVNKVVVVPFKGVIEHEPLAGDWLIRKFNELVAVKLFVCIPKIINRDNLWIRKIFLPKKEIFSYKFI